METKPRRGRYIWQWISEGYRICKTCDKLIETPDIRCPCCRQTTGVLPRKQTDKLFYVEPKRI